MIQRIFLHEPYRQRTLRIFFADCRSFFFPFINNVDFSCPQRAIVFINKIIHGCLYIWNFFFSCSTLHLTRSLRSRVKHSKRNSISTRTHVSFFNIWNMPMARARFSVKLPTLESIFITLGSWAIYLGNWLRDLYLQVSVNSNEIQTFWCENNHSIYFFNNNNYEKRKKYGAEATKYFISL